MRRRESVIRLDDRIGESTLFGQRHLAAYDGIEFRLRHPVANQRTAALLIRCGAAQDDEITEGFASGLEQKRYVENSHRRPGLSMCFQKRVPVGGDKRVDDRFQRLP